MVPLAALRCRVREPSHLRTQRFGIAYYGDNRILQSARKLRYTGQEKAEEGLSRVCRTSYRKRELRRIFDFKYSLNTLALTSGLGHPL